MNLLASVGKRLRGEAQVTNQLRSLKSELDFIASCSPKATLVSNWMTYGSRAKRYLPLSMAPILDRDLIDAAIAVGWHRTAPFMGHAGNLVDADDRLLMGRLIFATKDYGYRHHEIDPQDIHTIGHLAACALAPTRFGRSVSLVAAVPSSRGSNSLPYRIARDLAFLCGIQIAPDDSITFKSHIPEIKDVDDYWQKRNTLEGTMIADRRIMANQSVLLVDDVCRSGATFLEAARACRNAGAARVSVLAASKTYKFQRVPERASLPDHGLNDELEEVPF